MTVTNVDASARHPLRTAAAGGFAFTGFYLLHHILQGLGPASSTVAAVAAYNTDHRNALLASEIAVGLALLAFVPFIAALVPVVWRTGQDTLAIIIGISAAVFVALGFMSNAAETALIGVAGDHQAAAVDALNQLQGRTPIVWISTMLVASVSLAIFRTGIVWRWLGRAGLIFAAVFLLGSMFSVLGRTVEGTSSLFGVGLFIVWMLLLSIALLRAAQSSAPDGSPERAARIADGAAT